MVADWFDICILCLAYTIHQLLYKRLTFSCLTKIIALLAVISDCMYAFLFWWWCRNWCRKEVVKTEISKQKLWTLLKNIWMKYRNSLIKGYTLFSWAAQQICCALRAGRCEQGSLQSNQKCEKKCRAESAERRAQNVVFKILPSKAKKKLEMENRNNKAKKKQPPPATTTNT